MLSEFMTSSVVVFVSVCVCLLCRGLRTVRRSDYANRASPRSEVVGNGLGSMSPNISPSRVMHAPRLDTCRKYGTLSGGVSRVFGLTVTGYLTNRWIVNEV